MLLATHTRARVCVCVCVCVCVDLSAAWARLAGTAPLHCVQHRHPLPCTLVLAVVLTWCWRVMTVLACCGSRAVAGTRFRRHSPTHSARATKARTRPSRTWCVARPSARQPVFLSGLLCLASLACCSLLRVIISRPALAHATPQDRGARVSLGLKQNSGILLSQTMLACCPFPFVPFLFANGAGACADGSAR